MTRRDNILKDSSSTSSGNNSHSSAGENYMDEAENNSPGYDNRRRYAQGKRGTLGNQSIN
jgi:hypothetical protein